MIFNYNSCLFFRPRVILIEHAGKLVGLITVKDVLKYIARKEAEEDKNGLNIELTNGDVDDNSSNHSFKLVGGKRSVSFMELGKRRENDI